MRSAVNRIKDIANNLLLKNSEVHVIATAPPPTSQVEPKSNQLLSGLLDPLVTEKRMQFRSKIGIEIEGRIDAASYGLFASIQPIEFKRVISNLINNAVEALGETGSVMLSVLGRENEIEITIRDNGKGIPPEILAKLGQRGETHGKEGGSGLGLFHARTSVESWGGKLSIESTVSSGTSVIITLSRSCAPDWFVSTLLLTAGSSIVILDDDSSIHQIWDGRLHSLRVSEKKIKIVHVSTPEQFRAWVSENPDAAAQALYLTDYELLGYQDSGLSLVEELKLGLQSILVTSRFEERHIMEGCQRLKIRMIPKGMAGFVPIAFAAPMEAYDAILIDDDDLVHMSWSRVAKHAGKALRAFLHPDQFFELANTFTRTSPVYVDANLGNGIKGAIVAERIHKMGFTQVYLATGYDPDQFKGLDFLSGIIGKEPPRAWLTPPSA
jgi:anti-sigma regulatory factor (Ser/Thr protein kinase)